MAEDEVYLFSYSYWNPEEISRYLKVPLDDIISKIKPGYVENMD